MSFFIFSNIIWQQHFENLKKKNVYDTKSSFLYCCGQESPNWWTSRRYKCQTKHSKQVNILSINPSIEKKRGLYFKIKLSSEILLQNLSYFRNMKTQIVFLHFENFWIGFIVVKPKVARNENQNFFEVIHKTIL